jgi:hypothetical protein
MKLRFDLTTRQQGTARSMFEEKALTNSDILATKRSPRHDRLNDSCKNLVKHLLQLHHQNDFCPCCAWKYPDHEDGCLLVDTNKILEEGKL